LVTETKDCWLMFGIDLYLLLRPTTSVDNYHTCLADDFCWTYEQLEAIVHSTLKCKMMLFGVSQICNLPVLVSLSSSVGQGMCMQGMSQVCWVPVK
jgi:chloramphenicol 3-O-phosphotransferase